jgi:hypothetical protein
MRFLSLQISPNSSPRTKNYDIFLIFISFLSLNLEYNFSVIILILLYVI